MYHRIHTLADEERLLLEKKLALQSSIRAKRERQRRKRTHDTEVYSQMLEPVTKSIAKLTPITTPASPVVKQEPVKKEEEDDEEVELEPEPKPVSDPEPPIMIKEEEHDDLYQEALAMVPRRFREDGQLGLCPSTHQIGAYTYSVNGRTLQAISNHNENEEMHQFDIQDSN